ncbi:MAG: hypothetical protein HY927_05105 [Elusimicrobia bacterium]|nr:hypothetical protein [Elusimicrobiota bacterium]
MTRPPLDRWLRRAVLLAPVLAGLATPDPARGGLFDREEPLDFIAQARTLFHIVACAPGGEIPARFDGAAIGRHCAKMDDLIVKFRRDWVAVAMPYISALRPPGLPAAVVYPFGGGDLVSALATFPDAREVTAVSIEPAGDPRPVDAVDMKALQKSFAILERDIALQFRVAHSRTDNMAVAAADALPSQLLFALVALRVHGCEPASLRYFRVLPDGSLAYLTADDLAAARRDGAKKEAGLFENMELGFRRAAAPASPGHALVFRHFDVDLSDRHLKADPGLLRHLEAKGRVAAMTKAASYLLWEKGFSLIRDYLLGHMEWMLSDSTGIPSSHARAAGFVQDTYGRYEGPFLKVSAPAVSDYFVALWRSQPRRRLPFAYGYPDAKRNLHMMATRRPWPELPAASTATAAPATAGAAASMEEPSVPPR